MEEFPKFKPFQLKHPTTFMGYEIFSLLGSGMFGVIIIQVCVMFFPEGIGFALLGIVLGVVCGYALLELITYLREEVPPKFFLHGLRWIFGNRQVYRVTNDDTGYLPLYIDPQVLSEIKRMRLAEGKKARPGHAEAYPPPAAQTPANS